MVNYLTTKIPNENLASDSITTIQNNNSGIKISFNLNVKSYTTLVTTIYVGLK